jgi:cytochrome P450
MSVDYEPFSPADRANPYPVYAALRERDPVHWAPESKMFCVSRYEDVTHVLKHPELFSSSAMKDVLQDMQVPGLSPRYALLLLKFLWKAKINPIALQKVANLVGIDPPRHDAMRSIVNRGFTPRRIAGWEGRAREIVREQMRVLEESARFDVVDDLAIPLPVTIIAEMLGVESERRDDFKSWSDAVIAVTSGSARENPVESGALDVFGDLFRYLRDAVRARRRDPRDDLISVLVDPAQEGVLSELEVINFVVLLLVAGNETTTNLIGNAVNALLDHPAALDRVAGDASLVPALIDETLRFDAPIQLVFRRTTEDVQLRGMEIPKASTVTALLGSANRDPERFERPDEFDLDRDARGHLGFGLGVHFCLGSSLARLEASVALEALAPELPRLKPVGRRDEFIDSFLVRGRRHLLLAATPETA